MEGTRLIRSIRLENILSYGPDMPRLELEPLNVLIGPNASGKSNLIEVLSLLAAAPHDLQAPIREGGGIREWLWKGTEKSARAKIDVTVTFPSGTTPLRHQLVFAEVSGRFSLVNEVIENERSDYAPHYEYQDGRAVISALSNGRGGRTQRDLSLDSMKLEQSILSQRRDPDTYPELTYLAARFEKMRFYREWNLERYSPPRLPQKTDLRGDFLEEDASNLSLVLNDLQNRPLVKLDILKRLRAFYERVTDITTTIQGGTVQIYLHERGLKHSVSAARLSDGTLRYLCLLVILCHPEPPPLICIEEPEQGLHPDIIPSVAEMLIEASQRTQLVVTTHSDILVSALSDHPESVIVCERDDKGTSLQRLNSVQLNEWLERYRLGELWRMGEIGGNP